MSILKNSVIKSIEEKLKKHHELYPNIPVKAEYWESIASQSLNVLDWVPNNHNPNEDFKSTIEGLLEPSLKAGTINGQILKFSSHRMSKFSELKDMIQYLDSRTYDSFLFLAKKENELGKYYLCYMPSKLWKYSDLLWTPKMGVKEKCKGIQQGWKGEGLDGKVNVQISFKMSSQLWVDVDLSLITILKEILI